jgi:murein DD-endopeptidase MepM/ murein hydrolase activator NlpD
MKMKLLLVLLIFIYGEVFAQPKGVPEYFSYPLSIDPRLNANFGEMRPNHFHMGLDLSTESRENLPVYAPADGFISRMKIETGGFGRAIYMDHPNGTTTLYAHMNRFIPAAENYLEDQQYVQETWKIDLKVPAGLLPVKKGQLIGYSGNTGASQGPHVHFEIRDTETENCLNPLRFRFLLPDVTPPDVFRLVFYDRDKSVYEQTPIVYPLIKKGNQYHVANRVELPFEKVFMSIQATDRMTGVPNANGIFAASLKLDNQLVTSFRLDNISYDQTRYLNGHIDYTHKMKGGAYFQMLFPAKKMDLPVYSSINKQYFSISELEQDAEIEVLDAYENKSVVNFSIKRKPGTLIVQESTGQLMIAGELNIYDDEQIQFVFKEDAFYDDFHFSLQSTYASAAHDASPVYQTLPVDIPVQSYFKVRIKPSKDIDLLNPDRLVVKRSYRGKTEIKKAAQEKDGFSASFRDFGFFQLLHDIQPPHVSTHLHDGARLKAGSSIHFDVLDDLKVIKEFRVTVDGNWLMFKPSGIRYSYVVDEHFPVGEHKLTVLVIDEAGNTVSKDFQVTRN